MVVDSGINAMFTFTQGELPSYIHRRIKNAYETSLWDGWALLENGTGLISGTNDEVGVTAAGMRGNVALIFVVWGTGLGAGSFGLCLKSDNKCQVKYSKCYYLYGH